MLAALTWKIGAIGASAIAVTLGGALIVTTLEARRLKSDRDTYYDQIHDEETGFIVRLATCRINTNVLESSIKTQNDAIALLETETETLLADSAAQLRTAREEGSAAAIALVSSLSLPLTGDSTCERVEEVDQRFTQGLGQ
jgi:hypothetical protein